MSPVSTTTCHGLARYRPAQSIVLSVGHGHDRPPIPLDSSSPRQHSDHRSPESYVTSAATSSIVQVAGLTDSFVRGRNRPADSVGGAVMTDRVGLSVHARAEIEFSVAGSGHEGGPFAVVEAEFDRAVFGSHEGVCAFLVDADNAVGTG